MNFKENYQRYRTYLTQLFGELTDNQLEQVAAVANIIQYDTGAYLFREGDKENALYIVLTGRLRTLRQTEQGVQVLGDVSAGEPVGELALFTHEPRSASVVAIRKSTVLQIEEADYNTLVQQNPKFAHTLTQFVITRLRRNAFQQRMGAVPKNIAIVKLQQDFDISLYTDAVKEQLDLSGVNTHVYDYANQQSSHAEALFDEMENHKGLNFLVCDDEHLGWANQCITYCDLVLVVTDFNAPSSLYSIEAHLNLYATNVLNKKIYLILLHPENAPAPTLTRRWFEGRAINLHLHIRKNNDKDMRRFSRIITHQAVGLVLGGGGAKGFSHIGSAKAMIDAGLEFDFVGGTSAGALFGTVLTFTDFDISKITDLSKKGADSKPTSNDYNFPFLSLMTGRKMRKLLHDVFGEIHLEDIWVTTYVVSTNYSTASLKVHETGLLRQVVEASIAIPGVFPPVIIDRHLHVDGGVMDNLPIEAMYQKPVRHVIAISLTAQSPHLVEIKTVPSAWEYFMNKFTKKHRYRLPPMSGLLINSMILNSKQKQETTKKQIAMYLELDLRAFGFLDWSKWEKLIEKGYTHTQDFLKQLPITEQFWKK